jgi:hypothetical protein
MGDEGGLTLRSVSSAPSFHPPVSQSVEGNKLCTEGACSVQQATCTLRSAYREVTVTLLHSDLVLCELQYCTHVTFFKKFQEYAGVKMRYKTFFFD